MCLVTMAIKFFFFFSNIFFLFMFFLFLQLFKVYTSHQGAKLSKERIKVAAKMVIAFNCFAAKPFFKSPQVPCVLLAFEIIKTVISFTRIFVRRY